MLFFALCWQQCPQAVELFILLVNTIVITFTNSASYRMLPPLYIFNLNESDILFCKGLFPIISKKNSI